jgi:RNA polymerase sigma-70 factor, ECF subfamily
MSEPRPLEAIREQAEVESLMHRYQQSDREAAEMLVARLSPQIYQFYLGHVRDRSLAEDLLQDFWLRIHNARQTYHPGEPLLPWVYAIARRVRIDQYRRGRNRQHYEIQKEQLSERVADQRKVGSSPNITDVLKAVPEAQRDLILLLKVSGLSLDEAARATGSTVGAVKQKAHRAYEKLRKLFAKHEL